MVTNLWKIIKEYREQTGQFPGNEYWSNKIMNAYYADCENGQIEPQVSLGDSQPMQTAESSLRESALIEELTAVIEAGNMLAESIHYIQKEFDGIHRARLALANWYKVRANEYGRGKSSLSN